MAGWGHRPAAGRIVPFYGNNLEMVTYLTDLTTSFRIVETDVIEHCGPGVQPREQEKGEQARGAGSDRGFSGTYRSEGPLPSRRREIRGNWPEVPGVTLPEKQTPPMATA